MKVLKAKLAALLVFFVGLFEAVKAKLIKK